MRKLIGILFLLLSVGFFTGCVKRPAQDVKLFPQHEKNALTIHPHAAHHAIFWRCTVGTRHRTWHSQASMLLSAQRKAKHLCELFANGHGICRYKGCVQVKS